MARYRGKQYAHRDDSEAAAVIRLSCLELANINAGAGFKRWLALR
jgi:hypothetical protein